MRVVFSGALPTAIGAKDLVLRLIATIGVAGGRGYALEFDGEALRALAIEDRDDAVQTWRWRRDRRSP